MLFYVLLIDSIWIYISYNAACNYSNDIFLNDLNLKYAIV